MLVGLYGDKCVVTGARTWEAAQVLPLSVIEARLRFPNVDINNSPTNGIPLRNDLRQLFDTDQLGFFRTSGTTYEVRYFGTDPTYRSLNTKPPAQVDLLADQNVLRWRYQKCVAAANVPKVRVPAPKVVRGRHRLQMAKATVIRRLIKRKGERPTVHGAHHGRRKGRRTEREEKVQMGRRHFPL